MKQTIVFLVRFSTSFMCHTPTSLFERLKLKLRLGQFVEFALNMA